MNPALAVWFFLVVVVMAAVLDLTAKAQVAPVALQGLTRATVEVLEVMALVVVLVGVVELVHFPKAVVAETILLVRAAVAEEFVLFGVEAERTHQRILGMCNE